MNRNYLPYLRCAQGLADAQLPIRGISNILAKGLSTFVGAALLALCCTATAADYEVAKNYSNLRNLILGLTLEDPWLSSVQPKPVVLAVVIDYGVRFPLRYVLTVVTVADGYNHTSIYTSRGGAFIGLGSDPTIAKLSKTLLVDAERLYQHMKPVNSFPLPAPGHMQIYIVTVSGTYGVDVAERELAKADHPLHSLNRDYWEIVDKNPNK